MTDRQEIENLILEYPIYQYVFLRPEDVMFTERVRTICKQECKRYGTSWSCPPAVGTVDECRDRTLGYTDVLFFSTVTEVAEILDMDQTLATRGPHEEVTTEIEQLLASRGYRVLTLSSESCAICSKCAWPEGKPCRHPDVMHPCIESFGIVVSDLAEKGEMDYYLGEHELLWFTLMFLGKD